MRKILVLVRHLHEPCVERPGRSEVGSEGFLYYQPAEPVRRRVEEARRADCLGQGSEEPGWNGQVEDGATPADQVAERSERGGVGEVAPEIIHHSHQAGPDVLVDGGGVELRACIRGEGVDRAAERVAPRSSARIGDVDADDPCIRIQEPLQLEVVERRHQEALRQVAGGAENHDRRGRRRLRSGRRAGPGARHDLVHLHALSAGWGCGVARATKARASRCATAKFPGPDPMTMTSASCRIGIACRCRK